MVGKFIQKNSIIILTGVYIYMAKRCPPGVNLY